jgi:hypothetical protein
MTQLAHGQRLAILLPAVLYLCFADSLAAQPVDAAVVIHVSNSANVSPAILTEMGSYVRDVLARIRVEVIWVDETSRLHGADALLVQNAWSDRSTAHVSLAIITNAEQLSPNLKNDEMAMGWTPAGQSERAYVFYDRVEAFVLKNAFRVSGLRVSRVMAYATEHELGHLLIPPLANAHSDTGIMKRTLGPDDIAPTFLGMIGFSVKEGELMRLEIQRRISISFH